MVVSVGILISGVGVVDGISVQVAMGVSEGTPRMVGEGVRVGPAGTYSRCPGRRMVLVRQLARTISV